MTKPTKAQEIDSIIIGAGITGLMLAKALSKNQSVLVLEAAESAGGNHRAIKLQKGEVSYEAENGLRFFPVLDNASEVVDFLKSVMPEIESEIVEIDPGVIEDGEVKDFIGFGEKTPANYEGLNYFLHRKQIVFNKPVHEWPQLLINEADFQIQYLSQVSKLEVDGKMIQGVVVNGQKTHHPNQIFFCAPLSYLKGLMPSPKIASKIQNEFPRQKFVTAIQFDFIHKPELAEKIRNLLSEKDPTQGHRMYIQSTMSNGEPYYVIGNFQNDYTVSQWIGFLTDDEAEDTDEAGETMKKMKRAIKRAFPEFFEEILSERISIIPSIYSLPNAKLRDDFSLSSIHNFWPVSGDLTQVKNLYGSLWRVMEIAEAMSGASVSHSQKTKISDSDSSQNNFMGEDFSEEQQTQDQDV